MPFPRFLVENILKLTVALAASFLLFVAVSLLHEKFGVHQKDATKQHAKHNVDVDVIKKEKQEPKTQQQRIRQVTTSSPGGKTGSDRMAMRFTPDLGLDAGEGNGAGVELAGQELAAEVFEEGQTDEAAVPDFTPPVPYPERAREQGISGTVEAVVVVNHLGRVASIDITHSPGPAFTAEVRRILATWRFKPAMNKGVPVSVRLKQAIDFQLE
jgi:TonB family protein